MPKRLYWLCSILPVIWTVGSGEILNLEQLEKVLVLVSGVNLSDMIR